MSSSSINIWHKSNKTCVPSLLSEKTILTRLRLPSTVCPRSLAPRLERLLFTKATSIEAYRDLRTLSVRCNRLLSAMLQRQSREKEQAKALLALRRRKAIAAILGSDEKYQEVLCLVQRVQQLQKVDGNDASARLVQAFQTTPVARLGTLPWDEMIRECQSILSWLHGEKR